MDSVITALAPVFAIGLGLQAFIEWLDGPVFEAIVDRTFKGSSPEARKKHKAGIVRTFAIAIGLVIAFALDIQVLGTFEQFADSNLDVIDNIVAGFIISTGTDGVNQIVKYLQGAKENLHTPIQPTDTEN